MADFEEYVEPSSYEEVRYLPRIATPPSAAEAGLGNTWSFGAGVHTWFVDIVVA